MHDRWRREGRVSRPPLFTRRLLSRANLWSLDKLDKPALGKVPLTKEDLISYMHHIDFIPMTHNKDDLTHNDIEIAFYM